MTMNIKEAALFLSLLSLNTFNALLSHQYIADPIEKLFTYIYKTNFWQSKESISGPGSELKVTQRMSRELSALIKTFNITSLADAPCGDLNWMQYVNLGTCRYIGIDIVEELIERNIKLFGTTKEFKHANLLNEIIEKVDLIICRDMLAHLTDEQIFTVLRNFKQSGSKYLLATTNVLAQSNTFIAHAGDWRRLNLQLPPFNFPEPLALIYEDVPFEWERGKCLALWLLDDLKV